MIFLEIVVNPSLQRWVEVTAAVLEQSHKQGVEMFGPVYANLH